MGEIEKLTEARKAMSQIFPLSPSMWREWARDEASLSTGYDLFLCVVGFGSICFLATVVLVALFRVYVF